MLIQLSSAFYLSSPFPPQDMYCRDAGVQPVQYIYIHTHLYICFCKFLSEETDHKLNILDAVPSLTIMLVFWCYRTDLPAAVAVGGLPGLSRKFSLAEVSSDKALGRCAWLQQEQVQYFIQTLAALRLGWVCRTIDCIIAEGKCGCESSS